MINEKGICGKNYNFYVWWMKRDIIQLMVNSTVNEYERKRGKNNKSQRDIDYWPFPPAAETVVNMLIGVLTTRAKAMSSQSKYQWNDQEWEKYTEYFGVEREKKYAEYFSCSALVVS